jgi:hypothetical protein
VSICSDIDHTLTPDRGGVNGNSMTRRSKR